MRERQRENRKRWIARKRARVRSYLGQGKREDDLTDPRSQVD